MTRFLFVDRVLHSEPGKLVRGIKHITHDDFYLYKNRQDALCFMPSLIGETLGQLAAWNVMQANDFTMRPVAGVVSSARLHRPAYVGETLLLESFIDLLDDSAVHYHSVARVGDDVVFSIDGALGPLLPMSDFIEPELVRRQFDEINRPGEWPELAKVEQTSHVSEAYFLNNTMAFDHVLDCEPGVHLSAEKRITRAAPWFPDHFPNKPVLPLTVLLECKLNLAAEFVARAQFPQHYQVQELCKIKMNVFVQPGDVLRTYIRVKSHDSNQLVLNFRSEVDGKRVCVLDVVMTAKEDA